jgi:hypothetical protein
VQFGGDPLARRLWAARILLIPADQQLGGLVEEGVSQVWILCEMNLLNSWRLNT